MSNKKQSNRVGRCESLEHRGALQEASQSLSPVPSPRLRPQKMYALSSHEGGTQSALLRKVNSLQAQESKGEHNLHVTAILYSRIVNDIGVQSILMKDHFYYYCYG